MSQENPAEAIAALTAACTAEDGLSPFQDQALVDVERGSRRVVSLGPAIAVIAESDDVEIEFAVPPAERGRGAGLALAQQLVTDFPGCFAWAHGNLPAAKAIAQRLGFKNVRTLLQLRAPVPAATMDPRVRAFTQADTEAWLHLNSTAFAHHPEQGSITLDDFEARRASTWHDDENLMLIDGEDGLAGYAWVKPERGIGELYALGVAPSAQGTGLGAVLLAAFFERLRALNIDTAHLYVEGDNTPALGLYRSRGFTDFRVDVRYRHTP